MKKNKLAGMMLAGALAAVMVFPVQASETTGSMDETQTTENATVEYDVSSTYTVSIPKNITLSKDEAATQEVQVTKANIANDKELKIKITSGLDITKNEVTLKRSEDDAYPITSVLSITGETVSNGVIGTFNGLIEDSAPQIKTLNYAAPVSSDEKEIRAGSYSATLTFTTSIEDVASAE